MPLILLTGLFAVALWSLVAHRFERWGVAGPAALAVCGAVIVVVDPVGFTDAVTTPAAERAVEIVLAVLLFVDACEVRGGIFGAVGRPTARLVLIALPLSLAFVVLTGAMLLPGSNPLALVVIACIIMPTDFAPATSLLRSPWVPERVRRILAVESGYNDGLVSPVFGMSLALAAGWPALVTALGRPTPDAASENEADHALAEFVGDFLGAVPATAFAILIGAALGALFGFLARAALARGWANPTGVRYAMLIVPLLAYGLATTSGFAANGFVAAFVAGIFYRLLRARGHEHGGVPHDELAFVEDVGTFAASGVWFTLGALATLVVVHGVDPRLLLLALLALTVLRAVPVYTAMLGSPLPWRERTLIGLLGPRGTATIVFGMLAFAKLPNDEAFAALEVMVFTVLGSILLHGIIAPAALRRVPARSAG